MQDSRRVITQPQPVDLAIHLSTQREYDVYTPTRRVAQTLHRRPRTLSNQAIKTLESHGLRVVSALTAQTLLVQSLQIILNIEEDVYGFAKTWGATLQSLLKGCQAIKDVGINPSARSKPMLQVAIHYQEQLRSRDLVDPNELFWRASERQSIDAGSILVYGYCQPQLDELAWIDQLAGPGSVIFLPTQETPQFSDIQNSLIWLEQKGWSIQAEDQPSSKANKVSQAFIAPPASQTNSTVFSEDRWGNLKIQAFCYGSMDAEVRGTLAQVKLLLDEGISAREITVIARNETEYGPYLIDVAWEYRIPLRALYNTSLMSTRLGTWLDQLLEAIAKGLPFEETANLLGHPLCSNPDHRFWTTVRQKRPQGFQDWSALAMEHLGVDLSAIATAKYTRRLDTWVNWCQSLFKSFDLRRRCARWARESLAFNTLQDALVELTKLQSKTETEKLSWVEFRQQFHTLLGLLEVPAQPGRGGVELHAPQTITGTRYRYVFVLGMAEGIMPAPIQNDPVLDFYERQQLRRQGIYLPLAAELARREALDFYGLLQSVSEKVIFSYSKLKRCQPLLPSPYFNHLGIEILEPPEAVTASVEEYRRLHLRYPETWKSEDETMPRIHHALKVEQHRESSAPANEFDGVIGLSFDNPDWAFSVSQLTQLGQCPFKWFVNKLLKLGASEEQEDDLSPKLKGNLYHKVLELLVQAVQADPTQSLVDSDFIRAIFLKAEDSFQLRNIPLWNVRREDCLRELIQAIQTPEFWSEGVAPSAIEQTFEGEWQGFKVTGRVDRIDRKAEGLVLIDYKTSGSVPKGIKDIHGKASIDLQLSIYQEVAATALFPDDPIVEAYYYSLSKRKALRPSKNAPQHQLPEVIERMKGHLNQGSYPVNPDVEREACRFCDFDMICRHGSRPSRKEEYGTN